MDGEYFSTGQAAKLCAVTPDTVLKWIKRGRLRARRTPGGHYRISREDLDELRATVGEGAESGGEETRNVVVFSPGKEEGVALCGAEFPSDVRVEIVESGYELSAIVEGFQPDWAIIDAVVGLDRARFGDQCARFGLRRLDSGSIRLPQAAHRGLCDAQPGFP